MTMEEWFAFGGDYASWNAVLNAVAYAAGKADDAANFAVDNFYNGDILGLDQGLGQSQYNFNSFAYPSTLGNEQYNHYMVININVPVHNKGASRSSFTPQSDILTGDLSKVDVLRFGESGGARIGAGGVVNREPLSRQRSTRRIKTSIALFMPGPVEFVQEHRFSDFKLTHLVGGMSGLTGSGGASPAQLMGYPVNPRVEVLYSHTELRGFQFQWLFTPESYEDSVALKNIIRALRYHSAPELDSQTRGWTFIPPADFDITFYKNGVENTNIPRVNTCVLEEVRVDYTPMNDQWVTFSNGHPVGVYVTLKFREVEILHKKRVLQGF